MYGHQMVLNYGGDFVVMKAAGIPALNTIILLISGLTVTWAHHGLKKAKRNQLILGLIATVLLGFILSVSKHMSIPTHIMI